MNGGNYFQDMLPTEEMAQLSYIPTFDKFVEWIGEKWAELPAVSDCDHTYTYREMCSRIARRRAFLSSLGLQHGDRVAIFERSSIDAVELFLAVVSGGYVAVMVPENYLPSNIGQFCRKLEVSALALRREFSEAAQGLSCKVFDSSSMALESMSTSPCCKDEAAAIIINGGTPAAPQAVVLPHRALLRGAYSGTAAPGPQLGRHRMICFLPLSHIFGLVRSTLSAFYVGAEWYAAEDRKSMLLKMESIRPTMLVLSPGICDILLGVIKMYGLKALGGELRIIISGGVPVPARQVQEFDKFGIILFSGYGLTEGANLTFGNVDTLTHPDSVGKVFPEQEVKIVDGELWFRGDNTFLGYYGNPELTAKVLTPDGWVRTGDLARIDEDGFAYITGRITDKIMLDNDEAVSPSEIEEPFRRCAALRDCKARQDVMNGSQVIAVVITPDYNQFEGKSQAEILDYFKQLQDKVNAELPCTRRVAKLTILKN